MRSKKKQHPTTKTKLHPRSKHRERYDFKSLIKSYPELQQYVAPNKYGDESIDFFNAEAVLALNKSLLFHYYNLTYWDIPAGYLCPPIPGRADYIHQAADLLASSNNGKIPTGSKIKCLDIGVGANCIYPIIGNSEYGWSFTGTDIDEKAIASANKIIDKNNQLKDHISCRIQATNGKIFEGILTADEQIDITICNPPFHASLKESQVGTLRKLSNLKGKKVEKAALNFGGQGHELWTVGGEKQFILNMIHESASYAKSVCWFTTLVSKEENLQPIFEALDAVGTTTYETVRMGQGNKSSRMVAWSFLSKSEEEDWTKKWNT